MNGSLDAQSDTNIYGADTTTAASPGVCKMHRLMMPPMMTANGKAMPNTLVGWHHDFWHLLVSEDSWNI